MDGKPNLWQNHFGLSTWCCSGAFADWFASRLAQSGSWIWYSDTNVLIFVSSQYVCRSCFQLSTANHPWQPSRKSGTLVMTSRPTFRSICQCSDFHYSISKRRPIGWKTWWTVRCLQNPFSTYQRASLPLTCFPPTKSLSGVGFCIGDWVIVDLPSWGSFPINRPWK